MKNLSNLKASLHYVLLLLAPYFLVSCSDECEVENVYVYYEPIYTTLDVIRDAVAVTEPREIQTMGKIYIKDHYLYVNEPNEGIHVIDNSDPSNPMSLQFISVPGNFDLSIRGNVLFADSYVDLVAIDISNLEQVEEIGRIENLYGDYNSYGYYADSELGVVTSWQAVEEITVTESSCANQVHPWGIFYERGIAVDALASFDATAAVAPTNPGMGGSMARMTIGNDHLFAMVQNQVVPVDVQVPTQMQEGTRLDLEWGIETLFPKGNTLFVGANDGMYMVDIGQPMSPSLISKYGHVQSCDPVVVDGNYAFVTLRSGTACQGFTNQLEVIDISDLSAPNLLYTFEMTNPHGLGKDGNALFICDGDDGLKVFDTSNLAQIGNNQTAHYPDIFAYDVIPFNNIAIMIGGDGVYQYDYSDSNDIRLLSKISFNNGN